MNRFIKSLLQLTLAALLLSSCVTASTNKRAENEKLADTHYHLGIDALSKPGMLPKAFEELMRSNSLKPNQPKVLDALAFAWLLRGDLDQAEAHYKMALRHGAASATKNNYANLLNKLQRFPEAEAMARAALSDPRYVNQDLAFINLGDALLGQSRGADAIRAYQQAQVFAPNALLPEIKMAHTYAVENRLKEARLLYQALYTKEKQNRSIVEGYVNVLRRQGESGTARSVLETFNEQSESATDRAWALETLEQLQ